MAGTISSLGIGSGVLTADVIDQLREADESTIITPLETKIATNDQKSEALDLLESLLTSLRSSVRALDDDGLYQSRTVSGNNDYVSVTADDGVEEQDVRISDIQTALKNVHESGSFSATTAGVASGDGTMTIAIDGESFDIEYSATMSLTDLKDAINETAGEKVTASILQVGEDDYRLILTSDETGADQAITVTDSTTGSLDAGLYSQVDSIESGLFSDPTDLVASGAGTMTVTIEGVDYSVSYDATTTLEDLAGAINTAVGSDVASVHTIGSVSHTLKIVSTATGEDETLALTDNSAALDANITGYAENGVYTEIQEGRDATFKFNGIAITRSSNEIDDLVTGMTINLLQDAGSANISIDQNTEAIEEELGMFVESYNTLMSELDDMTLADAEEGVVGVFNGDNSINIIRREISRIITSMDSEGFALAQFGINLSQDGVMSFDVSDFQAKLADDAEAMERFFSGGSYIDNSGTVQEYDGVFTTLSDLMEKYVGYNGILDTMITASDNEGDSLQDEYTRAVEMLDARYETMAARFTAYDAIISRLNNQFSVLDQMIQAELNADS